MGFRIRATGDYLPTDHALRDYFGGRVKVRYPITLQWMEDHGIDSVFEGPQASGGTVYQYSQFAGIEQKEDGKWYTKYILGPVFVDTDEISAADQEAAYKAQRDAQQATAVRQDRNRRMAESDWTQLPDSPVDKAVWATYRQALRDVPVQAGFPWNVDWPTQPE